MIARCPPKHRWNALRWETEAAFTIPQFQASAPVPHVEPVPQPRLLLLCSMPATESLRSRQPTLGIRS